MSYCFILFLFEDYLLLRLVLVDCRSYLAIKLQVIQKVMWFTCVTNAARNYGYKCFLGESFACPVANRLSLFSLEAAGFSVSCLEV